MFILFQIYGSFHHYVFFLIGENDTGPLQDKKSLKLGPEDSLHLEGFALNVFAKADKQDRAGRADLYDKLQSFFIWLFTF